MFSVTNIGTISIEGNNSLYFYSNENTTIRYHCRVSPASNITWYFQRLGEQTPLLIEPYDGLMDITSGTTVTVDSVTSGYTASWSSASGMVRSSASVRSIKERYLSVENENLTIYIAANDYYTWHQIDGEYICAVDNEFCSKNASRVIRPAGK